MKLADKTIREIALEMPATTRIFEELRIDYCCGGNTNFVAACEKANILPGLVEEKISEVLETTGGQNEDELTEQVSPARLIDLIIEKHHAFTRDEIERLTPLMEKVARKHGERHPELLDLQANFKRLAADLAPHMEREEVVLFPFIKNLEAAQITGSTAPLPPFGTVRNPIRMMSLEHDTAGELLKKMRKVSNDYTPPENACPSFQALYFGLEKLEKDLHRHIHLENNLLFPLAIALEEKFMEAAA